MNVRHWNIGDPVIFEAKGRLVPEGASGRVKSIERTDDGEWITALFTWGQGKSGEYAMKQGDDLFSLDYVDLLEYWRTGQKPTPEGWSSCEDSQGRKDG
jgi:hypothetical protein